MWLLYLCTCTCIWVGRAIITCVIIKLGVGVYMETGAYALDTCNSSLAYVQCTMYNVQHML